MREPGLDRVETRQLQAANEVGVERRRVHVSMVAPAPLSKEHQSESERLSNALQLLESWHQEARREAGLDEGQVCAHIGNGKGGSYDQSQWTAARKSGNWPLGRMLAGCPDAYLDALAIAFATSRGLNVSHADIADLAVARTADAFEVAAQAWRLMQRRAG